MYQKLTLIGRLGADPIMNTVGENQVANFSLAVDDGWGDNKKTVWFRVSAWNRQAELAVQYLLKGSRVCVEGRLRPADNGSPRVFQLQSGDWASSYEVSATGITFLDSKAESDEMRRAVPTDEPRIAPTGNAAQARRQVNPEEIPF